MWATTLWEHAIEPVQWAAVLGASLVAAVWDIHSRRIPNLLSFPFLAAGLIWAAWIGGWAGLADASAGCLLLAFPFVLLFVYGGGGAGDAKLMGAIGAWLGVIGGLITLTAVTLCGGVLAIAFAIWKNNLKAVLANLAGILTSFILVLRGIVHWKDTTDPLPRTGELQTMPYGVAIFVGACLTATGIWLWHV